MKIKKIFFVLIMLLLATISVVDYQKSNSYEFVVEENGIIAVHFCPDENCSNIISSLIFGSNSVFCAFYEIKNEELMNVINEKGKAIVFEKNYFGFGTSVKSNGLMHNKFCIINESIVVTGSYNPTNGKNQDNIIIIESMTLAKNYLDEYFEIIQKKQEKTKHTQIIFNNYTLNNYFCPEDDCKLKILEEIKKAKKSIKILSFTFTDQEIGDELIRKHLDGVNVTLIYEPFQNTQLTVMPKLTQYGIKNLKYVGEGLQHNKVFIIDYSIVITGSYNPTKAAYTKNDENIIIIRQPDIVQKYEQKFLILLSVAETLTDLG